MHCKNWEASGGAKEATLGCRGFWRRNKDLISRCGFFLGTHLNLEQAK